LSCLCSFHPVASLPAVEDGNHDPVLALLEDHTQTLWGGDDGDGTKTKSPTRTPTKATKAPTRSPSRPPTKEPTAPPTLEHWSEFGCGSTEKVLPCNRVWGGRCEPGIVYGYNCVCNDHVLGATCDWNNSTDPSVLQRTQIDPKRIMMAYHFASIVTEDLENATVLKEIEAKCPRYKKGVVHTVSARFKNLKDLNLTGEQAEQAAATYAAAVTINASDTVSGEPEVVVMFRGTEFSAAKEDLLSILSGDATRALHGLQTVFTDLNIAPQKINYTDNITGEVHQLGTVHQGFIAAIAPYYKEMLYGVYQAALATGLENPVITVTGWSLGGALANVFTAFLRFQYPHLRINLITFGAPRVGDTIFNEFLRWHYGKGGYLRITRVVAGYDPVSMIPPSLSWDPLAFGNEVIHAGEQLTVALNKVEPKCIDSFIGASGVYSMLLSMVKHISCHIEGVSKWHTDYYSHLVRYADGSPGWFQGMGIPEEELWCKEKVGF